MNKKLIVLTSISVLLGAGYAAWIYTPLGKKSLSAWLLKKWEVMAKREKEYWDKKREKETDEKTEVFIEKIEFDKDTIKLELDKLKYDDLFLLLKYTKCDFLYKGRTAKTDKEKEELKKIKPKYTNYLKQVVDTGIFKRADLNLLGGIVFPKG